MDAREVDSNAVPFSGPLPRSNLNQKLALRLVLRMGALQGVLRHIDEEVIPWLDQPTENSFPDNLKNLLKGEELDSWLTPTDNFHSFNRFGEPIAN